MYYVHNKFCLFLDRRIIFDFETYGDSPVCLNREKLLKEQFAITQGFGITETGLIPTNALETKVKVISNEECYDTLKTGNNLQMEQFRQSLYDGVNEQVLCTLGLLKTVNGEKFRTVSYFLSLLHIRYHSKQFYASWA